MTVPLQWIAFQLSVSPINRNQIDRRAPHRAQRTHASRSRTSSTVVARCSSTRSSPSHFGHAMPAAVGSTSTGELTWMGRAGLPPASRSNNFSRARTSLSWARSAARFAVRAREGRFLLTAPSRSRSPHPSLPADADLGEHALGVVDDVERVHDGACVDGDHAVLADVEAERAAERVDVAVEDEPDELALAVDHG